MTDITINDNEFKSINQIKEHKKKLKEKKPLEQHVIEIRKNNMLKALEKRKENYEKRNKLKVIEHNISELINHHNSSDDGEPDDIIIPKTTQKPIKKLPTTSPVTKISNEINDDVIYKKEKENNNDYKQMMDLMNNTITNINKKVEKLYTLKKYKQPKQMQQPLQNSNSNNRSSTDNLLEAIKNKMLNN